MLDLWAAFLIAFPVLGTFFAPETYFASAGGHFPVPITQPFLVVCSLYIIGHFVVLARRQRLLHEPLAYAFVLLAFASMKWSFDPHTTFLRALRLLPLVGLAVLYAQAFTLERTLRIIVIAFLGSAICSIFMAVVVPSYGLDRLGEIYAHSWRGALINKNGTGFTYALGVVLCVFAWKMRATGPKLALGTAALCGLIVLRADSTTAVIAVVIAAAPTALLLALRQQASSVKLLLLLLLLGVSIGIVMLVVEAPDILHALGKSTSFNGRTPIWEAAWNAAWQKPLLGHAFAFWGFDYPERNQVWADIGLPAPHSHNSWLDLVVQLGIVGWALIALLTVIALARACYCWAILGRSEAILPFALLVVLIVRSQMEVQFTEPATDGLFWLVWVAVLVRRIGRSRPQARLA